MATGIYYPNSITFQGISSEPDGTDSCGPYGGTMNDKYEHGSSVMGLDMPLANKYHGLSQTAAGLTYFPSSTSGSNSAEYNMGDWILWDECNGSETHRDAIDSAAYVEWDNTASIWNVIFGSKQNIIPFFLGEIPSAGGAGATFGPDANKIFVTVSNTILTPTPSTSNDQYGYGGTATIEFINYKQDAYPDGQPNVSPNRQFSKRNEVPTQIRSYSFDQYAWGFVPQRATYTPGYRRMNLVHQPARIVPPWMQGGTTNRTRMTVNTNGRMSVVPGANRGQGLIYPPYTYPTNYIAVGGPDPPPFPVTTPTFTPPTPTSNNPGTTATAGTCTIVGGVIPGNGIPVSNGGSRYTQAPAVTLTGGCGICNNPARATATINSAGVVTSINVYHGGAGYTSCPTVTLAAPTPSNGQITAITPNNPGGATIGTLGPTPITVSPPGVTPTAGACNISQPYGTITSISVTNGGVGYTQAPTVTLTGGGGAGATATATINSNGEVTAINVTSGGSGYTSCPTVTFGNPGSTSTAGTCTIVAGAITNIPVGNAGTGYTQAPTVTLTGGGGTAATATATINSAGEVTAINVIWGGSGYTSCPTVTLSAPKGTATQVSTITIGGNPIGVSVGNPGNGYTAPPSVTGTPCQYTCTPTMSCWAENLARGLNPQAVMPGVWKKCRKQSSYNHWNGHGYVTIPLGGYVTYDCCGAVPPSPLPPTPPPSVQNPQQPTLPRNPPPNTVDPWCRVYVPTPSGPFEPFPSNLNTPPEADPSEIRGGACNYHKRHGKRNFMYNPHGIAPFQDRERRFELRGMGNGGTHELYGAIKVHRGIFFPFSQHQLFFTTFKYRSIDGIRTTANAEAVSAASTRVYKDMGSHNGAAWDVASFEECFDGATESELRNFLQLFGVIHGDIDTTAYTFIRMVGMVTYQGNMLDSNGKQYCLVYCNKSVPSTVTPIISLAGGYIVLTSSDDIEAKYITMRRIKYYGQ